MKVSRSREIKLPTGAHLVYLSREKSSLFPELHNSLNNRPVLLISDNMGNQRIAMLDLVESKEGQLHFEINKANILNRGLGIHPDIILLGGSEIDIAQLYREGQQALEEQEKKLDAAREEVNRLSREYARQKKALKQLTKELQRMTQDSVKQKKKITKQQHMIDELELRITGERSRFESLQEQVKLQEENLHRQAIALQERETRLNKQQAEIDKRAGVLNRQADRIAEQDEIIRAQEQRLEETGAALTAQRQVTVLISLITALVLILVVTLWFSNRHKKRSNVILSEQKKKLQEVAQELKRISITDQLTGIYNRKHLDEFIEAEIGRSLRYDKTFSVILADIDGFKAVNDTYGHLAGDEVLKTLVQILQDRVRNTDTLGRWGGEEFMVICPETGLEDARRLAEQLRSSVEESEFPVVGKKTSSFGVAAYCKGDKGDDVLRRADTALYQAKEGGKNQVVADSCKNS